MRRVESLLRRLGTRARARLRPLRRVPVEVWLGIIAVVVVLGGFVGAVVPLLTTGGRDPRAEVSGRYPDTLTLGQSFDLAVAIDNTSAAVITPICVQESSIPAGRVVGARVVFQGLETIPFVNGRACGGQLSGQEVINARVLLQPVHPGTAQISLVATQGDAVIGPELRGTLTVTGG